jgi:hypothetical protein
VPAPSRIRHSRPTCGLPVAAAPFGSTPTIAWHTTRSPTLRVATSGPTTVTIPQGSTPAHAAAAVAARTFRRAPQVKGAVDRYGVHFEDYVLRAGRRGRNLLKPQNARRSKFMEHSGLQDLSLLCRIIARTADFSCVFGWSLSSRSEPTATAVLLRAIYLAILVWPASTDRRGWKPHQFLSPASTLSH